MNKYERNKACNQIMAESSNEHDKMVAERVMELDLNVKIWDSSFSTFGVPDWVIRFKEATYEWPKEWKEYCQKLVKKADLVAKKLEGQMNGCPKDVIDYVAHDCDTDHHEYNPVFCASKGRPDEWDWLHISKRKHEFSRDGDFTEIKHGEWYFVTGFEFD